LSQPAGFLKPLHKLTKNSTVVRNSENPYSDTRGRCLASKGPAELSHTPIRGPRGAVGPYGAVTCASKDAMRARQTLVLSDPTHFLERLPFQFPTLQSHKVFFNFCFCTWSIHQQVCAARHLLQGIKTGSSAVVGISNIGVFPVIHSS
jgi:hypothetical protein